MKKKLSIFFALVLVASLCLIPSVAQAAAAPGIVEPIAAAGGTAEWSTDQANSGTRSVYINTPTGDDVGVVRISLPSGSRPQVKDMTVLSWMEYAKSTSPGGYGADVTLNLVPNEADVYVAPAGTPGTHWDILHLSAPWSGEMEAWLSKDALARTDIWLHSNQESEGEGFDVWQAGTSVTDVSEWYVARVEVILFGGGHAGYDGYIDDIIINTDTYDLEVSTETSLDAEVEAITAIDVSPTSIDFGTITPGTPVSGSDITVENIGTVAVQVNASLDNTSGAFKYLYLEGVNKTGGVWSPIPGMGTLAPTLRETCTTELRVPATYSAQGAETAILTFTAQTK